MCANFGLDMYGAAELRADMYKGNCVFHPDLIMMISAHGRMRTHTCIHDATQAGPDRTHKQPTQTHTHTHTH